MKTTIKISFFCSFLAVIVQLTSCLPIDGGVKPACSGYGYLRLKNSSINTIQVVVIDGTRYGSLSPGETETFKLAVGRHQFDQRSANGKGGCSAASVTIVECDTDSRECRH